MNEIIIKNVSGDSVYSMEIETPIETEDINLASCNADVIKSIKKVNNKVDDLNEKLDIIISQNASADSSSNASYNASSVALYNNVSEIANNTACISIGLLLLFCIIIIMKEIRGWR